MKIMNMRSLTKRLHIAVLGGTGMLGSDLIRFLGEKHKTITIDRKNYERNIGKKFDVLINANGNSRRFWANEHPYEDFEASTVSVAKSLFDFRYKKYIYISSPDVYEDPSAPETTLENSPGSIDKLLPYGFHKRLSEELMKRYASDFIILRSAAILGSSLKKGVVYDILCGNQLFVTLDSKMQFITTQALAGIIETLLFKNIDCEVFNVGGRGAVTPGYIAVVAGRKPRFHKNTEKQIYEMNVKKIMAFYNELKTSEEYIRKFVKELRMK